MTVDDPYNLQRFLDAQSDVFTRAKTELSTGRKISHWMWYMFPQVDGLGRSTMAQTYAITSSEQARAFLAHPVLGRRLTDLTHSLLGHSHKTAEQIFGPIDAMKFRSSMTLFAALSDGESVFHQAIEKYYQGEQDPITLAWFDHNA